VQSRLLTYELHLPLPPNTHSIPSFIYRTFPGDSELSQLSRIFAVTGTPTEESWPGVSQLPAYTPFNPQPPTPLTNLFPVCYTIVFMCDTFCLLSLRSKTRQNSTINSHHTAPLTLTIQHH
jgi:hypothetical protein